jgi:hypothetical protein
MDGKSDLSTLTEKKGHPSIVDDESTNSATHLFENTEEKKMP